MGSKLTVMRLYFCLVHPLFRASGKDKTMKRIPKTPIEFDYDLWTTEDGKCMVRVKRTGEQCEVSRETFRILRAEEKKLRRSYAQSVSDEDGDEVNAPVLSLDVIPEDDMKSAAWLADPANFADEVLINILISDFRDSLNNVHRDIFDQCLLGDKTIREFAAEYGLRRSTVWDIANNLRKNFKKLL